MFLIENIQRDNYSELIIFSRDSEGNKKIETVKDFRPYFYVKDEVTIPDDIRVIGIELGHVSLTGEKLKKIIVRKSSDISEFRNNFKTTYEADIPITQRYIIDVLGEVETYPLKVLALDIETDDSRGFPDELNPESQIICCSFCDNNKKKAEFFYKHPKSKVELTNNTITKILKNEEDLLEQILLYIRQEDPDIITGWNVKDFDLSYLIARMTLLNIDYNKMSPLGKVYRNKEWKDVIIRGRIVLDGMELYSQFRKVSNQGRAESYSLEFTGQDILNTGKLPRTEDFKKMWIEMPEQLAEYNLRDSELVIDILNKLEIVDFFNTIRAKSCSQLADIYKTTTLVDGFLLRKAKGRFALPSKKKNENEGYKGAYVFPPIPGVHENVIVFDVKGMYPNLIKTFNIGLETFNPDGEIKLKTGIGFNRGIGILSEAMRDLEKDRSHYKKLKANATNAQIRKLNHFKQYAVKVLMNSHYGYLGYPGSRFYKKEIAEAITVWGQSLIMWTRDYLTTLGYEIIYGDTDSIYLKAKNPFILKAILEGKDLLKKVNGSFKDFAKKYGSEDCTLEMEFEKVLKRVIFVAKKGNESDEEIEGAKKTYAYILAWKGDEEITDNVEFTGFASVRSDTPRIAKKTQIEVLERILRGEKKEGIIKYLRDLDTQIRTGKMPAEDIGFPRGISKEITEYGQATIDDKGKMRKGGMPPVIVGVKYANKYLGMRFGMGSKPKWVYIKKGGVPKGYPDTEVLAFEHDIPKGFIIDYDIMLDKIFKMKLEEIFRSAGFGDFPNLNASVKSLLDFEGGQMKQEELIKEFCKDANYYLIMFSNDDNKEFGKIIDEEKLLEDGSINLEENEIWRSIEDNTGNRLFVLDLLPKDRQFIDNPLQLLMNNLINSRTLEQVYPKIFTWVYNGLSIKGYAYVPSGDVKSNSTISRYGGTENFIKILRQHLKNIMIMKNGGSPDFNFLNINDRVEDIELSIGSINKKTHNYSVVIDPSMAFKIVLNKSKECVSRPVEINTLNMKYWAKEINPDFITEAKHIKLEKPLELPENLADMEKFYPAPIKRLMALKDKGNYNRFLIARFLLSIYSPKDAKFVYHSVLSEKELEHVKGGNCKTQWNFIMNNLDRYSCPSMKELSPFIKEGDEPLSHPLEKIQDFLNSRKDEDKD